MIKKIISTCSKKDGKIWQIAAQYILKHIDAEKHELIVPDDEVTFFTAITPDKYTVLRDSDYLGLELIENFKNTFPKNLKTYYGHGWYIQQFLKVLSCVSEKPDDIVFIWDADTIPLKKLHFVNQQGRLSYYKSPKKHKPPYFNMINRILSLDSVTPYSFIAQCFPLYAGWASEMLDEIEKVTGQDWINAIATNIKQNSAFSEYETLGTYIFNKYPDKVQFNNRPWTRYGARFFKNSDEINAETLELLSYKYDFIGIEQWDFLKPSSPLKRKVQQNLQAGIALSECYLRKLIH